MIRTRTARRTRPAPRRLVAAVAVALVAAAYAPARAQCVDAPGPGEWEPIGPQLTTVFDYARDPVNAHELYIGTFFGGLYKSVDFGFSWCHIPTDFSNDVVFSIEIVETDPRTLYVGTQNGGVYRSLDGGFTWAQRNTGLPDASIRDVLADPFKSEHLLACTFDGVYESFDGGASWAITQSDEAFLPAVTAVFDPVQPGRAVAVSQGLGIFESLDGGSSWDRIDLPGGDDLNMTSIAWDVNDPDRLLASSSSRVLEWRRDRGTWGDISHNLSDAPRIQSVGTFHGDSRVYAATDRGVYRLDPGSSIFPEIDAIPGGGFGALRPKKSIRFPLISDRPRWTLWNDTRARFVFNDPSSSVIHVAALFDFFELSQDGGLSFIPSNSGVQNLFCGALATADFQGETFIYAGTGADIRIRSQVFSPNPTDWARQIELGGAVFEITRDPSDPATLYAGTEGRGVFKTTDYGGAWDRRDAGMVPPDVSAIAQAAMPRSTIYAGTSAGVFVSTSDGNFWETRAQNQTPRVIADVEAHPSFSDFAFYTTQDGEVFRSVNAGREFFLTWTNPSGEPLVDLEVSATDQHYAVDAAGSVLASFDGGLNYFPIGVGQIAEPATCVTADSSQAGEVFVGTIFGGVYRSGNIGADWEQRTNGMDVPIVFSIAADPDAPGVVYAGGIGRVFKTTDDGQTWTPMTAGLPADGNVTSIVIDPSNPGTLYAKLSDRDAEFPSGPSIEGVFKSTDAGQLWTRLTDSNAFDATNALHVSRESGRLFAGSELKGVFASDDGGGEFLNVSDGLSLIVLSIVVDPNDPQTLYAASVTSGVFKSTDGAATWENSGLLEVTLFHITMDPNDSDVLYASTSRGPYVTRDAGATWGLAGQDTPFVFTLESDPADPGTVYVGSASGTMYISRDAGRTWNIPEHALPPFDVNAIAIDPNAGTVYAGLSQFDNDTQANSSVFFRSNDRGATWFPGGSEVFADERVIAMTVDGASGDLYLASFSDDGAALYASSDSGDTWTELSVDVPGDFIGSVAVLPNGMGGSAVFASVLNDQSPGAGPKVPLRRSLDGGQTWTDSTNGFTETDTRFVLAVNGRLIAVQGDDAIFESTDLGASWSQVGAVGDGVTVFEITQRSANEFYAATSGGVYRSLNGGATWSRASDLLAEPVQPTPHQIAPSASGVYAATFDRGVFFTEDDGASWMGGITQEHALMVPHAMAVDPEFPSRVLVATGNQGMAITNDGGVSWAFTNAGLGASVMFTVTIDPANPDRIYASSEDKGVWRSDDRGLNWFEINGGLFNEFVTAFTIDVNNPGIIYAGTEGGGVFKLDQGP